MLRSLTEWEALYERKTKLPIRSKAFARVLYDPGKGFMYYLVDNDNRLLVLETIGDGKHWEQEALKITKLYGCKTIFTTIYVDPKVYQRRYPEAKVFGTIMYREVD